MEAVALRVKKSVKKYRLPILLIVAAVSFYALIHLQHDKANNIAEAQKAAEQKYPVEAVQACATIVDRALAADFYRSEFQQCAAAVTKAIDTAKRKL